MTKINIFFVFLLFCHLNIIGINNSLFKFDDFFQLSKDNFKILEHI